MFFRKGVSSCVDFVISNCSYKISNVRTHTNDEDHYSYKDDKFNNVMSDHAMVSCHFNDQSIKIPQQYRIVRDYKLLTKHSLNQYFSHNDKLNKNFSFSDPNTIEEQLIGEMSLIIESIAQSKRIQYKNSYAPWINSEFIAESKTRDR